MKKLKDLHYGWVMVLLAAALLVTYAFPFYSFGIFLIPVTMGFNWERGAFSLAISMTNITSGIIAIPAGRLGDKYGPRLLVTAGGVLMGIGFLLMPQVSSLWQVYLIWALLIGIGSGCSYIPITSAIPRWFAQKRGLAMGFVAAGFGLGAVISPVLAQSLISSYSWRQAYLILGVITIIVRVPLAQFIKHSPQQTGLKPYGEKETTDKQTPVLAAEGLSFKQAIKTGRFWLYSLVLFFFLSAVLLIIAHLAPHVIDRGISETIAAGIVSMFATTALIGRFFIGIIADRIGARRALTISCVTVTAALIWLLFAKELWMLYIFAMVFGFGYGGQLTLQPLMSAELFGLKSLGIIMAGLMLFGTTGGALGAPIGGLIFDITGSYRLAFVLCVTSSALATIFSLILLKTKSCREVSEQGLSPSF